MDHCRRHHLQLLTCHQPSIMMRIRTRMMSKKTHHRQMLTMLLRDLRLKCALEVDHASVATAGRVLHLTAGPPGQNKLQLMAIKFLDLL
jgi:hypothetical protein